MLLWKLSSQRRARGAQRGQVLPLVALLLVLATGGAWAIAQLGVRAVHRAEARTAADAAALAGAVEGESAARELAERNGAEQVTVQIDGRTASVTVIKGTMSADAKARFTPSIGGLTPPMQAAIARAEQLLGTPIPIVSGYRSPEEQQWLWDNQHLNPYPVAPPGTSRHERGEAIDVPRDFVPRLVAVAHLAGLCQPLPLSDPVHFVLCRTTPSS